MGECRLCNKDKICFLVKAKGLNGMGMNPKCDITTKHVNERGIEEVFQESTKVENQQYPIAFGH
jgi:hypothetical protein